MVSSGRSRSFARRRGVAIALAASLLMAFGVADAARACAKNEISILGQCVPLSDTFSWTGGSNAQLAPWSLPNWFTPDSSPLPSGGASGPNGGGGPQSEPRTPIHDSGYDFLYKQGAERRGYGLYTYALLTPADRAREKAMLAAIVASTPRVTVFGADIADIDVIYIPVSEIGKAPGNADAMAARYNFDLARVLIHTICEMPAPDVTEVCKTGLGSGPYLFTYASPLSKTVKLTPPVLFVDLTGYQQDAFPTFVDAYKQQIKRDDITDGAKIHSLNLWVLNAIEKAKIWANPVEHAAGGVVHALYSEGDANGKAQ